MAEAHYIDLRPHNLLGAVCTAATIHLAAAVPNFAWLEVRSSPTEKRKFIDEEIFTLDCRQDGPNFTVPNTPGLGVEVDEDAISKQEFNMWEAPKLYRRDGSVQNW